MKLRSISMVGIVSCVSIVCVAFAPAHKSEASTGADESACRVHEPNTVVDQLSPLYQLASAAKLELPTERVFSFDGNLVTQHMPPTWWKPVNATTEELNFYGVPVEPADDQGGADWKSEWVDHFSGFVPASLCVAPTNGYRYSSVADPNWAGVVVHGTYGDYTEAYGHIVEPGTANPCGGTAIFDSWVGLGGYQEYNLLQAGVTVGDPGAPGGAGGDAAFWEALNQTKQNLPVYITTYPGGFVSPHDSVALDTRYFAGTNEVHFGWHNLTTGQAVTVAMTNYAGYSASGYYSGNSSDFINENLIGANVRSFDDEPWDGLIVRRSGGAALAPFSLPHTGLFAAQYGTKTIGLSPDHTLSTSSFNEHYFSCH